MVASRLKANGRERPGLYMTKLTSLQGWGLRRLLVRTR